MKVIYLLALLFILMSSCGRPEISDRVIIEGNVKNLPDGKLYLTEAHYWRIHLDSAECKNGHFRFNIKLDSNFYPYMASLLFPDSSTNTKYNILEYINEFETPPSNSKFKHNYNTSFYLQKGLINISPIDTEEHFKLGLPAKISVGEQTEAFYKTCLLDFGWLGNLDSLERKKKVTYFENKIREYPNSYYLLESIYNYKEQYTKSELQNILALFTDEIRSSKLGEKAGIYIAKKRDSDGIYPDALLSDLDNKKFPIIDTSAKLNMLVFWASWCGPCRAEIPKLKKVYEKFGTQKGFRMVSISLDDDLVKWKTALKQEKMAWPQLVMDSSIKEELIESFRTSDIPCIVFTNNKRQKIRRYIGYDADKSNDYDSLIRKSLN